MEVDINLQTKVAALLESYPKLEDKLIELSPVFTKLRNPVLRKAVAKVTSVQEAAAISGISAPSLIFELRKAVGLSTSISNSDHFGNVDIELQPDWLDRNKINIYYDARPIINTGKSLMQEIFRLALELEKNTILHFTTPFKPIPILDILKVKEFLVWSDGENSYVINMKA